MKGIVLICFCVWINSFCLLSCFLEMNEQVFLYLLSKFIERKKGYAKKRLVWKFLKSRDCDGVDYIMTREKWHLERILPPFESPKTFRGQENQKLIEDFEVKQTKDGFTSNIKSVLEVWLGGIMNYIKKYNKKQNEGFSIDFLVFFFGELGIESHEAHFFPTGIPSGNASWTA